MCQRIDTKEDELELDRTVSSAFRQWESLMYLLLDEEDMKSMSRVEHFCSDVRERLTELAVQS